jgi:hypothetical protein
MKEKCEEFSKFDDTYTFRLPGHIKSMFKKIPIEKRHIADHNLRLVIVRAIHDSKFDASTYLGDEEE